MPEWRPGTLRGLAVGSALLAVLAGCGGQEAATLPPISRNLVTEEVMADVETEPVPNRGDAADDPAIWVNQADPAQSAIIGTDKKGGLAVYDLSGRELHYVPDGPMNNVDLRQRVQLGGETVTLVTALHRDDNIIAIYRLDPATRGLVNVAAREITLGIGGYGSCMYRSPHTGTVYVFANSERGEVEQWELLNSGDGRVDGRLVRSFDVGRQTEGCVADDELALLFIGEEDQGIWVYGAEPGDGTARRAVDTTEPGGNLREDVEGLTLVYGPQGTGFLIASSQGDSTFAVYRREGENEYLGSFRIVDGDEIDGVSGTDGIDVTTASLGDRFPAGVFVAQDGENDSANQNFKLVSLEELFR